LLIRSEVCVFVTFVLLKNALYVRAHYEHMNMLQTLYPLTADS